MTAANDAPSATISTPVGRFDKLGDELLVNTATATDQHNPQITALSDGGFVVTWEDFSQGVGGAGGATSGAAVKAQVFAADGQMIGGELLVNTATASYQSTSLA